MASCVGNNLTKNYQNLIIGFQVRVKNVGNVCLRHSVVRYMIITANTILSILSVA